MLCERCRIREANIQYTEVINGVKKDHHFCAQCAKEMDFGPYSAIFDGDFPLGKLLSGLLGIENASQAPDKRHQIVCPTCGTGYDEFVKNSRFGCGDCYSVFGPLMEDSLKQLHGSVKHTGKIPKRQEIVYTPGSGRGSIPTGSADSDRAGTDISKADSEEAGRTEGTVGKNGGPGKSAGSGMAKTEAAGVGISGDGWIMAGMSGPDKGDAEREEEIEIWDARLKEALRAEDYEEAAICRDQIKELKKGYEANA